jgi:hypothetical protein
MASTVFSSTLANTLKKTLEKTIDDPTDAQSRAQFTDWCRIMSMDDQYVDDLETGGPGLASEKPEGQEVQLGTIREGVLYRYIARTFALRLGITEEAMEDNKYPKSIRLAKRLNRALWKTADIDATNMLVRAENASYVGGDGVALASASHTLPHGGTFSNTMATPMSPSVAAMVVATSAMRKFPGHDGITEGVEPKKIVCPTEQWAVWSQILGSTYTPRDGNLAEINVVKSDLSLGQVCALRHWDNTTTNWGVISDAEDGLNFRWRKKPNNRTWVENSQHIMSYSISARWARGWSDPRGIYFVGA